MIGLYSSLIILFYSIRGPSRLTCITFITLFLENYTIKLACQESTAINVCDNMTRIFGSIMLTYLNCQEYT